MDAGGRAMHGAIAESPFTFKLIVKIVTGFMA
jgi:hypothetical protein